jgi:hypothetical protein
VAIAERSRFPRSVSWVFWVLWVFRWHARWGPPSLGRSGESRCEKGPLHQKQTRSVSQCWMSRWVCVCAGSRISRLGGGAGIVRSLACVFGS